MNEKNKEAEGFYHSIFENIPNLVLILNKNTVIRDCNSRIESLLGYKKEDIKDEKLDKIVHSGYREKIKRKVNNAEDLESFYDSYVELVHVSGKKVEGNIQITRLQGSRRINNRKILLFEEITERQLEKLKTKLTRIRKKNRELEELVQTIFHDLKEPIRSIGSYIDIIRSNHRSELTSQTNRRLKTVKKNARRMEALMTDLSEISRMGGNKSLKLLNIEEIIKTLSKELEKDLGKFDLEVQENFPKIHFDPDQMKIVLKNLIRNGIEFNRSPKELLVGYERTPPGENIKLFVKDNGCGIPQEYQERVFEIFKVLDRKNNPDVTGAGLAICKRIVEDNGGRIWLESEEGSGTAVYFTVPIYEEDEQGSDFLTQFSLPKSNTLLSSRMESGLFDEETGLHNRRYFDQILEPQLERFCKNGHKITFLVLRFSSRQKIKYDAGETLYSKFIHSLTARLKDAIRQSDLILRLSENLFLIILPMTGAIDEVKDRMNTQITELKNQSKVLDDQLNLQYGASIMCSSNDPDPEEAIKSAEKKLYEEPN